MKYLLILLLVISGSLYAQFGPPTNLGVGTAAGHVRVSSADLDDDGDMDILSASTADDKIAWYENLGNDEYSVQKIISTEADEAMCIYAVDIDDDGDIDVLSASAWDHKIAWYENDGLGNFGPQMIISSQVNGAYAVATGDLDGDNDLDIIAASHFDSEIIWFENLGNGLFNSVAQMISNLDQAPYSLSLSDIDGDADLDVLAAYYIDTYLVWYPNDGTGTFGSGNVISSNLLYGPVVSVSTGDLDGDGDNDVINTDYEVLNIHENLGSGTFAPAQSFSVPSFRALEAHLADTDNDGDLDILAFFQGNVSNPTQLLLYENTGNLTFLNPVMLFQTGDGGFDIYTADLNQDGLTDIIAGYGSKVRRFLNLGQNDFGGSRILNTDASPNMATAIDMDHDGDLDILENRPLSWYPNEGGVFGPLRYIRENGGGTSFATSDFNHDNYPDIVQASDYKLFYQISLGSGDYGPEQLIDSVGFEPKVKTGDLNGDGEDDILCSIDALSKVKWFRNQNNGTSWQLQTIGNVLNNPSGLIVDLNQDGLNDILVYTGNSLILWHRSLGSGNFSPATTLDNSIVNIGFMTTSDLNNDGLTDLIYSYDQNKVGWKKNLGNGSFSPGIFISGVQFNTRLITEDVDSDGDQDILVSASWGSKIAWYENDGLANFSLMNTIYDDFYSVSFITTGDINGDTRPDLVSIPGIRWFENLGSGTTGPICADSIHFQITADTVCLGQTISGIIAPVADSVSYTWNLGNMEYAYGTTFSWISNTVGAFDLGINHVEGTCTRDTVVKVYVESCLTLEEYGKDVFSIYPNPSNMDLTISTTSDFKGELLVELENLLGQKIFQKSVLNQSNFTLPFSEQSPGVYLLSITNKATEIKQTNQVIRE